MTIDEIAGRAELQAEISQCLDNIQEQVGCDRAKARNLMDNMYTLLRMRINQLVLAEALGGYPALHDQLELSHATIDLYFMITKDQNF